MESQKEEHYLSARPLSADRVTMAWPSHSARLYSRAARRQTPARTPRVPEGMTRMCAASFWPRPRQTIRSVEVIMRSSQWTSIFAVAILAAPTMFGTTGLTPPNVTVGESLEVIANVALNEAAPAAGLEITLTSGDPGKVMFSKTAEGAGSPLVDRKSTRLNSSHLGIS